MRTLRIALCDLDGTLTDRTAGFSAWADAFAGRWDLSAEQRRLLVDLDAVHPQRGPFFAALTQAIPVPVDAEALWTDYRRQMPSLTPAVPGAHDALRRLRDAGWLLALVSNGKDDNQRGKLRATGLGELFDAVVVSDSAGVRKPDPAIFALALDALGVGASESRDCWVIGDDPVNDVRGGQAFGASTCWISAGRPWSGSSAPPTLVAREAPEGLRCLLDHPARPS